ncbi:MAG: putative chitinase, partial [Pseudomonadota bacterium]|nr:putative chitinase [Pseudomonadota bacterium]
MITTLVFAPADMPLVLTNCDPTVTQDNANKYGAPLLAVAHRYGITTPLRLAHFIAQLLHESGSLKYTEELASGAAYEGRKDLGNIQKGDGRRFRGRGLIQITGRGSTRRYSQFSGVDYVANPERMAELPASVDSAGWFWRHGNGDCN